MTERNESVLIVTQYFPPERGAAQVRLGALSSELARRGCDVTVVTALPNYPTGRIFEGWSRRPLQVDIDRSQSVGAAAPPVRVVRVWVWAAMGSGLARVANYLSFGAMSIVGVMRAGRHDTVVIEYPTLFAMLPALVWSRLRHSTSVVLVADLWVDSMAEVGAVSDGWLLRLLRRVERFALRRADVVTAVTGGVREHLLAKGVPAERVAWLPNGVDVAAISPGPADEAVLRRFGRSGTTRPFALYAGTHGYVHGLDVLLEAAELVGDRIDVVLVGDGSEKERLVEQARERGLRSIAFLDPISPDEVAALLRGALCGVATVRAGDLYSTVRSAKIFPVMASGVPVVYSADDEGSALVRAADAGLVTPAGDARALAAALNRLVDEPDLATRLGRNGRRWVEENASWSRLVGEWHDDLSRRRARAVSAR